MDFCNSSIKQNYVPGSALEGLKELPLGLEAEAAVALLPELLILVLHDMHGHGPPSLFNKTDLSFNAGPNFIPNECIK